MKILIRCDTRKEIGQGHAMRMLAFAQACRGLGHHVFFVCDTKTDLVRARIVQDGFEVFEGIASSSGYLEDARKTLSISRMQEVQWVVLDGYCFDLEYQRVIKEMGNVMVVDDHRFDEEFCADVLLNSNMGVCSKDYSRLNSETTTLLGHEYVFLREEFISQNAKGMKHRPLTKILVTMGGADPSNATLKLLNALRKMDLHGIEFRVIVGGSHPDPNSISETISDLKGSFELFHAVSDMAEMYRWAGSAISAVGSSTWEWLYFNLNGAILPIADNQQRLAKELSKRGLAQQIGCLQAKRIIVDHTALKGWLCSLSEGMSGRVGEVVIDGLGGKRVCEQLEQML